MSEEGTCSLQEPGGLCVHVCAIATGELSLVAGSCDRGCVYGRTWSLTLVEQLWVVMEVGGASVTCVCEGRVCSLRSCVRRCVLHLVPAQVLLWVERAWPTRVQAARRASAVLAVRGTSCSSRTAWSPRLSSAWAKAFVSL